MGYVQYMLNLDVADGDMQHSAELEIGAVPTGDGLRKWLQRSPSFNFDRVRTPLLITALNKWSLLAEWGTYSGLRTSKKPVDMVMLEDAPHVLVKPQERYASQESGVEWFEFWLNGKTDPDPAKREQYVRWNELCKLQIAQHPNQPAFCVRTKMH